MKNGILIPLVTPFKKDGNVDYDGLKNVARFAFKTDADGVYAVGSSGECFLMTESERKKCLEVIIGESGGKPVIAHIGHISLDIAVDLAKHAEHTGATGIASVPPFYFRFSFEEVKNYFYSLADSVSIPLTVYNLPAWTRLLSLEECIELLNHKNVHSMKFTDTNYFMLERIKTLTGKFIYSGCDECFLSALAAGADGAIGTTFNYMIESYIETKRLYTCGRMNDALKLQARANAVTKALLDSGKLFSAVKYLMTLRGVEMETFARRPLGMLTEQEKAEIKKIYEENVYHK